MIDRERVDRRVATIEIYGRTLDGIVEKATVELNRFFGEHKWEFLEIKASPSAQLLGGRIITWLAEIEAGECWG